MKCWKNTEQSWSPAATIALSWFLTHAHARWRRRLAWFSAAVRLATSSSAGTNLS